MNQFANIFMSAVALYVYIYRINRALTHVSYFDSLCMQMKWAAVERMN